MKQVIPFYKEIVFKTKVSSIINMSLEHEERIGDGEIVGDFIIYGEYKVHSDTTEVEKFRYRLPFTALIPDNILKDTINIDIENFYYELLEEDVVRVDINFSIEGDEMEEVLTEVEVLDDIDREIDEILDFKDNNEDNLKNEVLVEDVNSSDVSVNIENNVDNEYVVYHVYSLKEDDTLDNVISNYKVSFEMLKEYNDLDNIKTGDKIIIPEYGDE